MQLAPKATVLSNVTRNNGHWPVQGHSRSPIYVPIESLYARPTGLLPIIKPPDIHVGELRFYVYNAVLLSLIFFFFVSYPPHSLNGTQTGHMLGSECDLKMHVRNRGPKYQLFRRFRNLRATLTVYIFGMKHDIQACNCVANYGGLLHRLKTTWTLVHKRLQIGRECSPTLYKFCIPLHCHRRQRWANRTHPSFAKRWTINRANNLPLKIWGHHSRKKLRLNGEYNLLNETWYT